MIIPNSRNTTSGHVFEFKDKMLSELEYRKKVEISLKTASPELLMSYSKEAFENLFEEILLLTDEAAVSKMSESETFLHQLREREWKRLFDKIWQEIHTRGDDIKKQLIATTLNNNSLIQKLRSERK